MSNLKRKIFVALVSLAMAISVGGCNNAGQHGTGEAPTYQGMTLTRASEFSVASRSKTPLRAPEDEGEEQTPVVDDHTTEGHEEHDDLIEHDISTMVEINVQTDEEVRYYVKPSEAFVITVHLSNPGLFEIQSFTLNGKKYANYMFKEGSDLDNLYLEVTAPATPGYTEYTIDAIKYIDGTEIKDVDLSTGNKSVKAGVTYENGPQATIEKMKLSSTAAEIDVKIDDKFNLIGNNPAAIYVTDGTNILLQQEAGAGLNKVLVQGLTMSTRYQIGVSAVFDQVDGKDVHQEWILREEFVTEGAFSLVDVVATKTGISFDVKRNDQVGEVTSISLYDSTTKELVEKKLPNERSFSGLLSNHSYDLYIDFNYVSGDKSYEDWVVEKGVTTVAKVVPVINLEDITSTKDDIGYAITAKDDDHICTFGNVELYRNGELIETTDKLSGVFSNLLSDNRYVVRVYYSYDLNDGDGVNSLFVEKAIKTVAKVAPEYNFGNVSVKNNSITYEINKTDVDSVSKIKNVELIKGGEVVATNEEGKLNDAFLGVLSDTTYTMRINYEYDLNNGSGPVSRLVDRSAKTLVTREPHVEIDELTYDQSSISYQYHKTDEDNACEIKRVELVLNGQVVATNDAESVGTFTGLLSDNKYTVRVVFEYDMNNGDGPVTDNVSVSATTLTTSAPTVSFEDLSADFTTVSYQVSNVDNSGVCNVEKIDLELNGEVVATSKELDGTFENLLSNHDYTIKVYYTYNINDGRGNISRVLENEVTTLSKEAPRIKFDALSSDKTGVNYSILFTDRDSVGSVTKVELRRNGEVVKTNDASLTGSFDELYSNNNYVVRVYYTYDVNEGAGPQQKYIEKAVKTTAVASPVVALNNVAKDESSIKGTINLRDPDQVATIDSVKLYKGDDLIAENEAKKLDFANLLVYTDYRVEVSYTYNLNDGAAAKHDVLSYEFKTSPEITFNSCSISNTSAVSIGETIYFEALISNNYNARFNSVVINGKKYAVDNSSTQSHIYANIENEGQFGGGEKEIAITGLYASLGNEEYFINISENNSATVFVNSTVGIKDMYFVDENNQRINRDYLNPNEETRACVEFDNESGYEIYNVSGITSFYEIDTEHAVFSPNYWWTGNGSIVAYVEKISYRKGTEGQDGYINKTIDVNRVSISTYKLSSEQVVEITTADQLLSMNGNCYYKLMNDINLDGREWEGNSFSGVFDGNGHKITNMKVATTYDSNDTKYLGLFRNASGVISNLTLENVTYLITASNYVCFGAFAANSNSLIMDNCHITGESLFALTSSVTNYWSDYAGGFIGSAYQYLRITNSSNSMNLSGSNSSGGFVGYASCETGLIIENSNNNGRVTSKQYGSGFIGRIGSYNFEFENCQNNGSVQGYYAGGFVAYTEGNDSTNYDRYIKSCVNNESITATSEYAGGFAGYANQIHFAFCTNNGDISGRYSVGGIVGSAYKSYINNCVVNGEIKCSESNVGGLAGRIDYTSFADNEIACKITGTYYVGNVAGSASHGTVTGYVNERNIEGNNDVGGIFGSAYYYEFVDCVNKADVTGNESVGGLVGYVGHGTIKFQGCSNLGDVIANRNNAGGIFGYLSMGYETNEKEHILTELTNYGNVIGSNFAGGIGGYIYSESYGNDNSLDLAISELSNLGKVQGSGYTGGIFGQLSLYTKESITIQSLSNYGDVEKITSTSSYNYYGSDRVGGLVGSSSLSLRGENSDTKYPENPIYVIYLNSNNNGEISGSGNVGGLFGYAYNTKFEDCINTGRVSGTSGNVGGLAGNISFQVSTEVSEVVNQGSVNGNENVGGLFGFASKASIGSCENTGEVSGISSVGSLIGYVSGIRLENYHNTQSVSGENNVGGIFGTMLSSTLINCSNEAIISGNGSGIGGLVGYVSNSTFEDCSNSAAIEGSDYVGGIFGQLSENVNNNVVIKNCVNTGSITSTSSKAGGLFGGSYEYNSYSNDTNVNKSVSIISSSNEGEIVGNEYVGGLFGCALYLTIEDSENNGSIDANNYVGDLGGGVINSTFSELESVHAVTGNNSVGSLFGYALNCTFERCVNKVAVTGASYVGGLVGSARYSLFIGCTNEGDVTGSRDYVGGLVGGQGNNGYYYGENKNVSQFKDCINNGKVEGRNYVAGIAGDASNVNIINCRNNKTVKGTNNVAGIIATANGNISISGTSNRATVTGQSYVAGILSTLRIERWYDSNSNTQQEYVEFSISDCSNTGLITSAGNAAGIVCDFYYQDIYANLTLSNLTNRGDIKFGNRTSGGLFGYMSINTNKFEMKECNNYGVITSEGSSGEYYYYESYCGGIAGTISGRIGDQESLFLIENCNNHAEIKGQNYTGSLFGQTNYSSSDNEVAKNVIIKECNNNGEISGNNYVGGFIGNANNTTLNKCINNFNVTGASYVGGYFGRASGNISIVNCELRGNKVSGNSYVGGILGCADNLTLDGMTNSVNVVGDNYVGGIAGRSEHSTVSNCTNNKDISGNSYVGGIAGSSYRTNFINCVNNNDISGSGSVGGIVGQLNTWYSDNEKVDNIEFNITSCINRGNIVANDQVGGIVGNLEDRCMVMDRCDNSGNISGRYSVGGLVGYGRLREIKNCSSSGKITSEQNQVGQIAGSLYQTTITNCEVSGSVSGVNAVGNFFGYISESTVSGLTNTNNLTSTGNEIGGIAGNAQHVNFVSCVNNGNITGRAYVGGIVGYSYYCTFESCSNNKVITGTDSGIGGICGRGYGNISFKSCVNQGAVSGNYSIGGILGQYDGWDSGTSLKIEECENFAAISGFNQIGGILGNGRNIEIKSSTNSGDITCKNGTAGGIVGSIEGDNNSTSKITDCTNSGAVIGFVGTVTDPYGNTYYSGASEIGGIVGRGYYVTIRSSSNSGAVSGTYNLGGIMGYAGNSTIVECTNTGRVSSTYSQSDNVGQIVGGKYETTITDCTPSK